MNSITGALFAASLFSTAAFAQGLGVPLGPSGGGAIATSSTPITPNGVASTYAATLGQIAAQQGVLLDTFKLSTDADDTPSLTRAVAAGVPILLGPRTYSVHDFNAGAPSTFIMRCIPGVSVIQRVSASGSDFFFSAAATSYIDGCTFDMNSGTVAANQWGVRFSQSNGQKIIINNSVFKNNSGTLGTCIAILGTGPAEGGFFSFTGNEVTNCTTLSAAYFASCYNGTIDHNNFHDNQLAQSGIDITAFTAATSSNYATNISVTNNKAWNNINGIYIGGIGVPYNFYQNWGAIKARIRMFITTLLVKLIPPV
jgi:hypothetical protein